MDERALAAAQADLVAWGLLDAGPPPRLSRRFRAALARAAMGLREAEQAGQAPPGHPLVNAVAAALGETVPSGRQATPLHRDVLAAVELASLPPAVRALLDPPARGE